MWLAATCEQRLAGGFLGEPANTLTSLAFVVVGTALLARWRGRAAPPVAYGLLVVAVGVGSAIQHGPHPAWQAYAHDLPLAAVLAYVAVDAAADLTGRRLGARWWLVPAAALVPLVAAGPAAATAGQAVLAVAAVGLNLWRVRARPRLRRTLLVALALLAAGALLGNLGDRTGWCRPESLWQGHAAWHLLAAAALAWLAPAVGRGRGLRAAAPAPHPPGTGDQPGARVGDHRPAGAGETGPARAGTTAGSDRRPR